MALAPQMEATRKELEDKSYGRDDMAVRDEAPIRPIVQRKWTIKDKRLAGEYLILHLLCLLAPFQFTWPAFWLAFALYIITGMLGTSLSYHRHLTHKSFKLPKWLEYTFAYIGVHAFQGDPIDWVSTHRYHHQFADTEKDPHTPTQGFLFGYITWIFDSYGLTKKVCPKNVEDFEEMERKETSLDNIFKVHLKYGKQNNVEDLQKQVFYRFLRRTYLLHHLALALLLYSLGGLPFLVWGLGVRTVWFLHVTFLINSLGHMWGNQKWNTEDQSKNNWVLALLTFGEGWHNNHHAFEYSARHGLEWWQLDVTWCFLLFLEAIGLASDLKLPSQNHLQKLAIQPKFE